MPSNNGTHPRFGGLRGEPKVPSGRLGVLASCHPALLGPPVTPSTPFRPPCGRGGVWRPNWLVSERRPANVWQRFESWLPDRTEIHYLNSRLNTNEKSRCHAGGGARVCSVGRGTRTTWLGFWRAHRRTGPTKPAERARADAVRRANNESVPPANRLVRQRHTV